MPAAPSYERTVAMSFSSGTKCSCQAHAAAAASSRGNGQQFRSSCEASNVLRCSATAHARGSVQYGNDGSGCISGTVVVKGVQLRVGEDAALRSVRPTAAPSLPYSSPWTYWSRRCWCCALCSGAIPTSLASAEPPPSPAGDMASSCRRRCGGAPGSPSRMDSKKSSHSSGTTCGGSASTGKLSNGASGAAGTAGVSTCPEALNASPADIGACGSMTSASLGDDGAATSDLCGGSAAGSDLRGRDGGGTAGIIQRHHPEVQHPGQLQGRNVDAV
ncbi:hypothetical protein Vretifemale_6498 [Volvox reticuliferus]|uniref:Uncharacterized protein n=1 Tax=Volvox reticuliferus TaxID=1737510 RepID=A0A8J4C730_9CHLO|nr:hypothetical protein Vretifemale_6498 [Volvox reticuliferus]